mgnify:CR=1 FL=1
MIKIEAKIWQITLISCSGINDLFPLIANFSYFCKTIYDYIQLYIVWKQH